MDVSTGISTIPIKHLSRIEHEWLLTAEHGGTRGLPIRSGMVFEAPDTDLSVMSRIFQLTSRDVDLRRYLDTFGVGIPGQYLARGFSGSSMRFSRSRR